MLSGRKVCRDQRSGKPSGRSCRMRRSLEWIFFKAGLADRVTEYFTEMAAGPGMVRRTLHALGKGEK